MTDTKAPELLPCPFCGGEAEYISYPNIHLVHCFSCGLEMDAQIETKAEAITAWNTRTDTAKDKRIAELEAEIKILNRVIADIDERLCCDGTDCGCRGSTKAEQARHYIELEAHKAENDK